MGGNGSLYSYSENYTSPSLNFTAKYTSVDISASIGHFFVDKFVCGIRPTFSSSKGENFGGGSTNYYRISVGPFTRYYFLKQEKQYNILADISYQLGVNQQLGTLHDKGKYNSFSIMGGTEVFFNSSAGLEILLGYSNKTVSIENSPGQGESNKKGFTVSVGFQIHLTKD